MTLDEAIEHAEDTARQKHKDGPDCTCAVEHQQLAEWLKELKALRERDATKIGSEVVTETP